MAAVRGFGMTWVTSAPGRVGPPDAGLAAVRKLSIFWSTRYFVNLL